MPLPSTRPCSHHRRREPRRLPRALIRFFFLLAGSRECIFYVSPVLTVRAGHVFELGGVGAPFFIFFVHLLALVAATQGPRRRRRPEKQIQKKWSYFTGQVNSNQKFGSKLRSPVSIGPVRNQIAGQNKMVPPHGPTWQGRRKNRPVSLALNGHLGFSNMGSQKWYNFRR